MRESSFLHVEQLTTRLIHSILRKFPMICQAAFLLQVGLTLLVARNTRDILKVCHILLVIEDGVVLMALIARSFPVPPLLS